MLAVRKSNDRGHANHGWLDSKFTFSFADYHDPEFMGFRALRVINEDVIQGGGGFGTHGHREMEIVTYVLDGGIAHKDSLGSGGVIVPGELPHQQPDRFHAGPSRGRVVTEIREAAGSQQASDRGGQVSAVFERDPTQHTVRDDDVECIDRLAGEFLK